MTAGKKVHAILERAAEDASDAARKASRGLEAWKHVKDRVIGLAKVHAMTKAAEEAAHEAKGLAKKAEQDVDKGQDGWTKVKSGVSHAGHIFIVAKNAAKKSIETAEYVVEPQKFSHQTTQAMAKLEELKTRLDNLLQAKERLEQENERLKQTNKKLEQDCCPKEMKEMIEKIKEALEKEMGISRTRSL